MIAAADGGHLWSERYDREVTDIFALQDEISAAIARALRVRLSGQTQQQRYVPKLGAYEAYLRAKHHQAKVTPEAWDLAKACYESAVDLDPAYTLRTSDWVFTGWVWATSAVVPHMKPRRRREPRLNARSGLTESFPKHTRFWAALAAQYDFDWDAAERHFDVPLARQAGFALTRPLYGGFLFMKGNAERAVEIAERTIAEDPLEVWPRMNLHAYLQAVGRDREAYEQAQKVLELDPNLVVARVSIAHFHADWGQLAGSREGGASGTRGWLLVSGHARDARRIVAGQRRRRRGAGAEAIARLRRGVWRLPRAGGLPLDVRGRGQRRRLDGEGHHRA